MRDERLLEWGYYLDESDPDLPILRRQDGSFVAAFSALGATREGIVEAAAEDQRKLLWYRRVGTERTSFLDRLPEQAVILDGSGTIVAANESWKRFARDNGADPGSVSEGTNYLHVCERATGDQSDYAWSFAGGLRSVLSGTEERFALEYPCHSPTERRWFQGIAGRLSNGGTPLVLVAHENVTVRVAASGP